MCHTNAHLTSPPQGPRSGLGADVGGPDQPPRGAHPVPDAAHRSADSGGDGVPRLPALCTPRPRHQVSTSSLSWFLITLTIIIIILFYFFTLLSFAFTYLFYFIISLYCMTKFQCEAL